MQPLDCASASRVCMHRCKYILLFTLDDLFDNCITDGKVYSYFETFLNFTMNILSSIIAFSSP